MDQLGSYRLRKRLAVGGMGEVYLGEKIGPEGFVKPVVLKCVLPQLAKDRAFVQLFLDEARLAALLNHPNIAQVYDFGLVDDIYYIAMEYVPGYTVDDIRRKLKSIGQFMPLQHIACIASQVCQGLHYAHMLTDANGVSLGLVHRDVSPHNLIVSIDGSVKIVDFGIAKARAGLTRVQAKGAVGKFGYMSPEQSRGEQVDGRSDTFSLGICLWELMTNERLHDPNLDRAPNYAPTRPVRSVETFRSEVPRQFQEILETSLAIQPQDRYITSQDMHIALERFQAAMTHYAGQAALAAYIKDLVEGRVENPEQATSGRVVEPAGKKSSRPTIENMDAAQKYEEVFGVTMKGKRQRPQLRAVPKSWETREKRTPPPAQERKASKGPRMIDLSQSGSDVPALAEPIGPPTPRPSQTKRSTPLPTPVHQPPRSKAPLILALLLLVLGGAGYGAYEYRDRWMPIVSPPEAPPKQLTSKYRIETTPPGAVVLLDEQPVKDPTPVEVELIPDIEYRIVVRKDGFARKHAVVKASVAAEVRRIPFVLEKAATLRITTMPPGARVVVDELPVADRVTPMVLKDVPSGRPVKVRVEVDGLPPAVRTVNLKAGKSKKIEVDLDRG
ncbi:MAG: serine/threonine-protein kinase [Deltaproteobacteria bacterium]